MPETPKRKPGRPRKNLSPLDKLLQDDPTLQLPKPPELPRPDPIRVDFRDPLDLQLFEAIVEFAKRKAESLSLYEPLPNQVEFHRSRAKERILRGSVRAGKTLPAAVEIARAVVGRDPYGKYPLTDGVCFIVGPNETHLGDVIYKKLFRAGPFKMIRDLKTKLWRPFRPWTQEDAERDREARHAPPLIPPRFIKEISWIDKKHGIPKLVRLTSGWEIHFFTANTQPQRGVDIDLGWFDEEIESDFWYSEISARLLDREGVFIWSAAPQSGTQQLYEIHKRCEEQLSLPEEKRRAVEFHMKLKVNPYIKDEQKQLLSEKLTEDERTVLIEGEYAYMSYLVWPEFSKARHGIQSFPVPGDWSHYMLVDTGRQVCGTLFFAIPPDDDKEWGGRKICIDELYITACSAKIWGEHAGPKLRGRNYVAFVIDRQGSRQSDVGSGQMVEDQYRRALEEQGAKSRMTGTGFLWGSPDVPGRISKFRSWLEPAKDGVPTFCYFVDICASLPWEFERYHNQKVKGVLTDKPVKKHDHLMDLLGYASMHGLPYMAPPAGETFANKHQQWLARHMHKSLKTDNEFISLG